MTSQSSPEKKQKLIGVRRVLAGFFIILLVLGSAVFLAGIKAKADLAEKFPPPGQMVDVGGYSMHIYCLGEGTSTVVMLAGQGECSLTWASIQPVVAKKTRVCVYDRAGFGWSDPSPKPRTVAIGVEELHTLLTNAGVDGPYILVGHSLGGLYARYFADRYPGDVVGIVLVDSAHEEQLQRFPEAQQNAIKQYIQQVTPQLKFFKVLSSVGLMALSPSQIPVDPRFDDATAETYRALLASDSKFFDTLIAEILIQEESLSQIRAAQISIREDIPLVVLAHGITAPVVPDSELSPEVARETEQVWRELQTELAALSSNGRLIVAEQSGHHIHLDQPDLVINAIFEILQVTQQ